MLIRDPASITLNDVLSWLGGSFNNPSQEISEKLVASHPWYAEYNRLMGENRQAIERNMAVNLRTLLTSRPIKREAQ